MRISDFPVPDTLAARGALALAEQYQSPAITAHALRSWLWAEAFAVVDGIRNLDRELLYVAAVLHDIGAVGEFDNHRLSYEHAGGHVGVALTAGAGWEQSRRERVLEVIVRHNWPSVDSTMDAEGYLLEIATGLDISGARPDALPEDFRREVLAAHPRGALAAEFGACVVD
ncbi:HD domain-containing protein [Microbacterium enclense]|uniref:HD domain-containing protein n=1 Tax=Microbacterium enclense TaxID=993073 RepID=A0A1G6KNV6_9MICO|nr:HD domain-containing protein [Microbacterium enclense]